MSDDRIEGLRRALEVSPENAPLRRLLAESLEAARRTPEALDEYERLLLSGELDPEGAVRAGLLALDAGRLSQAARCLEAASGAAGGENTTGVAELRARLEAELTGEDAPPPEEPAEHDDSALAALPPIDLDVPGRVVTFADVGGLADVKKTIHRTIVLPYQRPDLYLKYGRRAGGGVMLYGAPGCGKTMLARATAGECGLPFFNVRIEAILDPMLGVSERNLHDAFEHARLHAPCVLFLDELDALAYARRKQQGSAGRALVDQLLQELDAIGSDNNDILILSATNAPWDVDDGLKRPGRLDRLVFVPPPDAEARGRILELLLAERPAARVDTKRLVRETRLFSGADLTALVEAAVDEVIEEALDKGGEPPLEMRHFETALAGLRPSTLEWLRSARNFVEFSNDSGRYDDIGAFLRSREAKAAR